MQMNPRCRSLRARKEKKSRFWNPPFLGPSLSSSVLALTHLSQKRGHSVGRSVSRSRAGEMAEWMLRDSFGGAPGSCHSGSCSPALAGDSVTGTAGPEALGEQARALEPWGRLRVLPFPAVSGTACRNLEPRS